MKKILLSAFVATAIIGASGAQAAQKPQDPIKQECHKQNPKDHKAYLKCVNEHSKQATTGQSASAQPTAASSAAPSNPAPAAK